MNSIMYIRFLTCPIFFFKESFIFLFFILAMPHDLWDLSFSFAVAKTFNTVLKRSGESGYPCLVPDFSRKLSAFTIEYYIGCGFVIKACYYVLSILTFARVFIMNGCWFLSNTFSASIDMIMLVLSSFVGVVYHIVFNTLNHCHNPGINSTWVVVYDLFYVFLDSVC